MLLLLLLLMLLLLVLLMLPMLVLPATNGHYTVAASKIEINPVYKANHTV